MQDRRKLLIVVFSLLVVGMAGFTTFRYLVLDDLQGGGLEFRGTLKRTAGFVDANLEVRSSFMEKGGVEIVLAQLDGKDTITPVPVAAGEVGPWKPLNLRFKAPTGKGPHQLEVTARYKTLFGQGAMHQKLTLP